MLVWVTSAVIQSYTYSSYVQLRYTTTVKRSCKLELNSPFSQPSFPLTPPLRTLFHSLYTSPLLTLPSSYYHPFLHSLLLTLFPPHTSPSLLTSALPNLYVHIHNFNVISVKTDVSMKQLCRFKACHFQAIQQLGCLFRSALI